MKIRLLALSIVTCLISGCYNTGEINYRNDSQLQMWYDRPAGQWEEMLPLGNGRLGMMADARIDTETVVLNDISLWSGGVQDAGNPEAVKSLPEIRRLLSEGRNDKAQDLMFRTFVCGGKGSGNGQGANVPYGSYEVLGNLHLAYQYPKGGPVKNYRRSLSLNDAVSRASFIRDEVKFSREYFADFVNDVLVVRLYASEAGALAFSVGLDRQQAFETKVDGNELVMNGQLSNGTDGKGMRYQARVAVKLLGMGRIAAADGLLKISEAQEALIIISAATDYKDANYEKRCRSLLDNALATSKYTAMKAKHSAAYQEFFKRASITLPSPVAGLDTMPTDRRLVAYADNAADNAMIELYFQFGRYLLISSARPDLLPPNLQGLWANTVQTPWNGDYHLDINVEMNHWPVEATNLAELHRPLIRLVSDLVKPGERTAKTFYNADGWVAHVITNIWGYTEPGEHPSWGAVNSGGAWLCAHLWEHYEYNPDRRYLQSIYPVLKGASDFFLSTLVAEPKHGWLVTSPSNSPENSFYMPGTKKAVQVCMGPTMDNQLVRELFTNTAKAAALLDVDAEFRARLERTAAKLPPNRVGSDGRLMEWLEEYEEPEPRHRHVSHLYGLHPSNQITPDSTPALAAAARKTLEMRGDGGTGWSRAWKVNFWARLHDGNHAFKLLHNLLNPVADVNYDYSNHGGTYPNLFCAHPPFQIDGNFGGCAGIAEMLLQSHAGIIDLLPALPDAFPEGTFDGLRARGGLEISAAWNDKCLTSAKINAVTDANFKLRFPATKGVDYTFTLNGQPIQTLPTDGRCAIEMKKNDVLKIRRNLE